MAARVGFLKCTHMLMCVIAHGGCNRHHNIAALKVDNNNNNKRTKKRDMNLHQYCSWLLSQILPTSCPTLRGWTSHKYRHASVCYMFITRSTLQNLSDWQGKKSDAFFGLCQKKCNSHVLGGGGRGGIL